MGLRCRSSLLFFFFLLSCGSSHQEEVLRQGQWIRDGETLLSAEKRFEMGFFSPGSSKKRYLGIWLKDPSPEMVVWVANKYTPIEGKAGVLHLDDFGRLILIDRPGGRVVWSSPGSSNPGLLPIAKLHETGNLAVRGHDGEIIWQSIDEPTHVLLPGTKLSANRRTNQSRLIAGWKSADDPSPGTHIMKMDFAVLPRVLGLDGERIKISSGHFNGMRFVGIPYIQPNPILKFLMEIREDEADYSVEMNDNSTLSFLTVGHDGLAQRVIIDLVSGTRKTFTFMPADECDLFAACGPFSVCNMSNFPVCGCLDGYQPKSLEEWNRQKFSGGCVRRTLPDSNGGDGFLLMKDVKLPHLVDSEVVMDMTLTECEKKCARDCSCAAYASANVTDKRGGCIIWKGEMLDIRVLEAEVHDLYVRVPKSYLENNKNKQTRKHLEDSSVIAGLAASGAIIVLLCLYSLVTQRRRTGDDADLEGKLATHAQIFLDCGVKLTFDFQTLVAATSNFHPDNKIGEGGHCKVYKGVLCNGREIAVKKFAQAAEFENEIKAMAKLRHRNLVPLLGWCVAGGEKMAVYELMRNKSLDNFIFDESKRPALGWRARLDIVQGIARGLTYLHHDVGTIIIHGDLKPWNILLDDGMVPKIADFGTARVFAADQALHQTHEVIGTHGYMSPEYAIDGVISTKSDVFSFGVVTLEIITGNRSRVVFEMESEESLLSKAWRLWKNGHHADLIYGNLTRVCPIDEVLRCIQVSLLCVQEEAKDRPSMATVATMLSCETFPLPEPKKPGFVL
ncbi:receptor-like serine/threonine-protein kinase SD1-8 [Wolffia australiana]